MNDLAPCPFCGGAASFERMGNARQSCIVLCEDCGCRLEANESWKFSGTQWNGRHAQIPLQDRVDAFRASGNAQRTPEPLSLQGVREDERLACWKIADRERTALKNADPNKEAWLVAFDIANTIKMRGTALTSTPSAAAQRTPGSEAVKLVYVKRWRTIVKLPAKYADEIVEALRVPAQRAPDEPGRDLIDGGITAWIESIPTDAEEAQEQEFERFACEEVARAIRAISAQRDNMARMSASEVACYRWPENTVEHRAMRAAFCEGAAHISQIVEEVPANKGLQEETLSESGIPNRTQDTLTSTTRCRYCDEVVEPGHDCSVAPADVGGK